MRYRVPVACFPGFGHPSTPVTGIHAAPFLRDQGRKGKTGQRESRVPMDTTKAEAIALQIAELQAQLMALAPVKIGDRVCFEDAERATYYGTVHALGRGRDGMPVAGLLMAGQGWLHAEPLANLRRCCGLCADCRTLNCRPGCAS
jgi:hypothetical protein